MNSDFSLDISDSSASRLLLGGSDCRPNQDCHTVMKNCIGDRDSIEVRNHEIRLREINTLEWDELLDSNGSNGATLPRKENSPYIQQYDQQAACNLGNNGSNFLTDHLQPVKLTSENPVDSYQGRSTDQLDDMISPWMQDGIYTKEYNGSCDTETAGAEDLSDEMFKDGLHSQNNLGRWMNDFMADSSGSVDGPSVEYSAATSHESLISPGASSYEGCNPKQIFCITDVSPTWAYSAEETKILVAGFFHHEYQHLAKSSIFCTCGNICVPAQAIQVGVFRCLLSPHGAGSVSFYLSFDRCTPISQVITFEFRPPPRTKSDDSENNSKWDMFQTQMRLACLLFSTSKSLEILCSEISQNALEEGRTFALKYSNVPDNWEYFTTLVQSHKISLEQAKDSLFELAMKSRLKEWLFERILDGSGVSERDAEGQGVLHLCAILGYTWVVYPFSCSGLSLDFRDKSGWTALHWAAYYGREKMVAALLSAGAKPNLVTDPTSENPGGCTAADLASKQGFEGLAAYLSEKGLVQQFRDMKIAGNVGGETPTYKTANSSHFSEDEINLKESLAAYRTAADAAASIQAALREHALKQRTKAVELCSSENEARYIVAAMKIQHAYQNYETRKTMAAVARIQHRFRTWKSRKEFLNMRQQAIKIQAAFRGFQVRRQYRKIVWSVGVLEKAVLRWRRKRKGFRGLHIVIQEPAGDHRQENDPEEDFYRASRKQAEERIEKAVVRVQAMFRSRKAQQEYRRMKLAHNQAQLEYEESANPGMDLTQARST